MVTGPIKPFAPQSYDLDEFAAYVVVPWAVLGVWLWSRKDVIGALFFCVGFAIIGGGLLLMGSLPDYGQPLEALFTCGFIVAALLLIFVLSTLHDWINKKLRDQSRRF